MTIKDDLLDVTLANGNTVPAAYFNSIKDALQPLNQTAAEVSAGETPTNYAYDTTPYNHLMRWGALSDDSTDNTAAIQSWLNVLEDSGDAGIVPNGIFQHDSPITIATASAKGFKIQGVSTGDYGSSAGTHPVRGSIFKYMGSGVGLTINTTTTTAPKYVHIDGITFDNGGTATDGLRLISTTWCKLTRCVFAYYDDTGSNGLRLSINSSGFLGGILLNECDFIGNYRGLYADSSTINILHGRETNFHSNIYGAVFGVSGANSFFRDIQFTGGDFEENDSQDILFNGGCLSAVVEKNYFEQNNASENSPRIEFAGAGPTNGFAQGISIANNTFSKQLQAAGQSLIKIRNFDGLYIHNNCSAYPTSGSANDRYFVELVNGTNAANFYVEPSRNVSGATPYPILYGGVAYSTAIDTRARNFLTTPSIGATVNNQSSNYTIAASDAGPGKMLVNGGASTTYTLEDFATVPIPVGSTIKICNAHSTNNLTVARSGTALYQGNADSDLVIAARRIAYITHATTDVWLVEDASGLS